MSEFTGFPKIARLNRECVITEKIDGTNAQVVILPRAETDALLPFVLDHNPTTNLLMLAGSRTRYITPTDDNFGFAAWVRNHSDELWALGDGRHFGEWWGGKIQRGYGVAEKRFSLFNTHRWGRIAEAQAAGHATAFPACCSVVPVLYSGPFSTEVVGTQIERLRTLGSIAAPGFMQPEGLIVFHTAASQMFKVTLEKDAEHKGRAA